MHIRMSLIESYIFIVLTVTVSAQFTHPKDKWLAIEDYSQDREMEKNVNTLQNEHLFLTHKGHLSNTSPFTHGHKAHRIKSSHLQTQARRATRGYNRGKHQLHETAAKIYKPHPDRVLRLHPNRRRPSKFWLRKHRDSKLGSSVPIAVHAKRMKLTDSERWHHEKLHGTLHNLRVNSKAHQRHKGSLRKPRSSCSGGKVLRRGKCRCPFRSNWSEEDGKCVCMYGTYKDSNGNCRPYI